MSDSLDMGYYRLALYDAKRRNLSKTIIHARKALLLNAENESARRLLGICLYEMGDLDGAAKALDGCTELIGTVLAERSHMNEALDAARGLASRKKWRKAGSLLCNLGHQSVRILIIRGCFAAASKRYKAAAKLFAAALEKDKGNSAAGIYLNEMMYN